MVKMLNPYGGSIIPIRACLDLHILFILRIKDLMQGIRYTDSDRVQTIGRHDCLPKTQLGANTKSNRMQSEFCPILRK